MTTYVDLNTRETNPLAYVPRITHTEQYEAALRVCGYAIDVDDARLLLGIVGIYNLGGTT